MISDQIKQFLDFVEQSRKAYAASVDSMKLEEKKLQDFLHDIEFESSSKERSKICTRLHISRKKRREYKDCVEELEEIVKFFQDPQHKKTLDQMTQLLGRVRKVEKYHKDRTYYHRVKEE